MSCLRSFWNSMDSDDSASDGQKKAEQQGFHISITTSRSNCYPVALWSDFFHLCHSLMYPIALHPARWPASESIMQSTACSRKGRPQFALNVHVRICQSSLWNITELSMSMCYIFHAAFKITGSGSSMRQVAVLRTMQLGQVLCSQSRNLHENSNERKH